MKTYSYNLYNLNSAVLVIVIMRLNKLKLKIGFFKYKNNPTTLVVVLRSFCTQHLSVSLWPYRQYLLIRKHIVY